MKNFQETDLLTEEIDLMNVLKHSKKSIKRWKKTIITFAVLGILAGGTYYLITPKIYKSRMYVASNLLKGTSFVVLLDDLQRHMKEQNYTEVARLLNMDSVTVTKIQNLNVNSVKNFAEKEFSNVITMEEAETEDESVSGEFIIEAFVEDIKILKPLEKGLVYYLSNNEYIKTKSMERKENLRSVKNKVHDELQGLDSLKESLSSIYSGNKKSASSNLSINDPSAIYNNIITLYQSEINAEVQLRAPDISIVQGFIPYKKHFAPRLGMSLITGFFISIAAAIVYILFREVSERVLNKL